VQVVNSGEVEGEQCCRSAHHDKARYRVSGSTDKTNRMVQRVGSAEVVVAEGRIVDVAEWYQGDQGARTDVS
jgi:hypothetical protein